MATAVCKATEFTEILSFCLYGLSDLCGEENRYTLVLPLPSILGRAWSRGVEYAGKMLKYPTGVCIVKQQGL